MTPEFSRTIALSEIGTGPSHHQLEVSEDERTALIHRFGLRSLSVLSAACTVHRDGDSIWVKGQWHGAAEQPCVVTGQPVKEVHNAPLDIRFIADTPHAPDTEIELDADDCDTMFHDGRMIDLGEAVAQSLALALNPFPRCSDAGDLLKAAGVKGESDVGPFGALAGLRDKLGGN